MAESLSSWMIFTLGLLAGKQFWEFFLKCKQKQGSEKKNGFPLNDGDQSAKLFMSCWRCWRGNRAITSRPSCLCSYQLRIVPSRTRCHPPCKSLAVCLLLLWGGPVPSRFQCVRADQDGAAWSWAVQVPSPQRRHRGWAGNTQPQTPGSRPRPPRQRAEAQAGWLRRGVRMCPPGTLYRLRRCWGGRLAPHLPLPARWHCSFQVGSLCPETPPRVFLTLRPGRHIEGLAPARCLGATLAAEKLIPVRCHHHTPLCADCLETRHARQQGGSDTPLASEHIQLPRPKSLYLGFEHVSMQHVACEENFP